MNWRGKETHVVYVGTGGVYNYSTVQGALDSINDAAADNRYVVVLSARESLTDFVVHNKSHVDLIGEDRVHSIIERPSTQTTTGGTIQIASDDTTVTEDVLISNLHIVRNASGLIGGGFPPEAALFVGKESTWPTVARIWDNITVAGNLIEGVHDGIQMFGMSTAYRGADLPRLYVRDNIIKCVKDASTIKGEMVCLHERNTIFVKSSGYPPYLTDVGDWKSTGFHYNAGFHSDGVNGRNPNSLFVSNSDVIEVEDGTNVADPSLNGQGTLSGMYFYNIPNVAGGFEPFARIQIINPTIRMRWTEANVDPDQGFAAINMQEAGPDTHTDDWNVAEGGFVIQGGSIHIVNESTSASSPLKVYGILFTSTGSIGGPGSRVLKITGTHVYAENNASGGIAYAALVLSSGTVIQHKIATDQTIALALGGASVVATVKP